MRHRTSGIAAFVLVLTGCSDGTPSVDARGPGDADATANRSTTSDAAGAVAVPTVVDPPPPAAPAVTPTAPAVTPAPSPTAPNPCAPQTIDPATVYAGDVSVAAPAFSEAASVQVRGGEEDRGIGGVARDMRITSVRRDGEYSVVALSDGRKVHFRIPAAIFPLRAGMEVRVDAGWRGPGSRRTAHAIVYDKKGRVLIAVVAGHAPEDWTITTRLASATRIPDTEQCEEVLRYYAVAFEHQGQTGVVPPGSWRRLKTPDGTYYLTAQSWHRDHVAHPPPSETFLGENVWTIVRSGAR